MAKVTIDIPDSLADIANEKNVLLMGIILAVLINKLIESTRSAEELIEKDLDIVHELDKVIKEDILKHYPREIP